MVIVPAGWLAGRLLRWYGISLIVTNLRLILRRGLLGRDIVQLRLNRVSEVHSTQSPLERLLGSGRLVVEVFGELEAVVVDDVRRPKSLQRVLTGQLDGLRRPGDDPTPPRGVEMSTPPPVRSEPYRPDAPADRYQPDGPAERYRPASGVQNRDRGSPSVAEQLIALDDLRRRGIVTEAEFEAKKTELLGRL
jgi:hypothetical protein